MLEALALSPRAAPTACARTNVDKVEWIGYVGRAISHQETPNWTLGPYLVQTLLLLLAPALFAASIYMELSRIILLVDGESHALLKRNWLTKLFVCGDVLSFLLQMAGKCPPVGEPLRDERVANSDELRGWHSSCRNRRSPRYRNQNHHWRTLLPTLLLHMLYFRGGALRRRHARSAHPSRAGLQDMAQAPRGFVRCQCADYDPIHLPYRRVSAGFLGVSAFARGVHVYI